MKKKIVSVNIEGSKHLDLLIPFLVREDADIVCLMEVNPADLGKIVGDNYPFSVYAPNVKLDHEGNTLGVAILSKQAITPDQPFYCDEYTKDTLNMFGKGTHAPVVLFAETMGVKIGSVHFTWTEQGGVDNTQRRHVGKLLKYLSTKPELVLCGDFNIPRPNEMYQQIAEQFQDNIPNEIDNSIDPKLHRVNKVEEGKLKFMVDYVWTCLPAGRSLPKYKVSNVRMVEGVSDHLGVVFEINLKS